MVQTWGVGKIIDSELIWRIRSSINENIWAKATKNTLAPGKVNLVPPFHGGVKIRDPNLDLEAGSTKISSIFPREG